MFPKSRKHILGWNSTDKLLQAYQKQWLVQGSDLLNLDLKETHPPHHMMPEGGGEGAWDTGVGYLKRGWSKWLPVAKSPEKMYDVLSIFINNVSNLILSQVTYIAWRKTPSNFRCLEMQHLNDIICFQLTPISSSNWSRQSELWTSPSSVTLKHCPGPCSDNHDQPKG